MEPTFHFICGIKGCPHSFKFGSTFSSFKTHASRKHPNWQEYVDTAAVTVVPSAVTPKHSSSADSDEFVNDSEMASEEPSQQITSWDVVEVSEPETMTFQSCSEAQKRAALFLLTFKEKYQLSQTAIDFAVGSIQSIVDGVCTSAVAAVETDLSSAAAIAANIEDPFVSLRTNYQQSKFYREIFGLVVSASICLYSCVCVSVGGLLMNRLNCIPAYRNLSLLNWAEHTSTCYLEQTVDLVKSQIPSSIFH